MTKVPDNNSEVYDVEDRRLTTQFVDSLFPCNPVLVTVTLYLDYLLFRYFQYAFHLDVFSIWRKSTEEIHTILRAGPDAFVTSR